MLFQSILLLQDPAMDFSSWANDIGINFPWLLYFYYRDQLTDFQYPEPSLLLSVFQPSDVVLFQWTFPCGQDSSPVIWSQSRGHFFVDRICGQVPTLRTLLQVYILWTFGCSCGQAQCSHYYSYLSVPFHS